MKIIGITGGTGCGKTTALRRIEALGGAVIDCDEVYHELLETDGNLLAELSARFPEAMSGGRLDRKALGRIVFSDEAALADLNAIIIRYVNREVWRRIEAARAAGCPAVAVDAINLLEGDLAGHCDVTVAVTAPVESRVQRLIAREGISEEYARLRIGAQQPNEYFSARCDKTLVNDCAVEEEFAALCDAYFQKIINEEGIQHE